MRNKLLSILLISSFLLGSLPPAYAQEVQEPAPVEETPAVEAEPVVEIAPELPVEPVLEPEPVVPPAENTLPVGEPEMMSFSAIQEIETVAEPLLVDTADITLEVHTGTETLFSGELSVAPCAPEAGDAETASAYCAMEQSGLDVSWSWFGPSAFLNTAEGVGNGLGSDNYWFWFSDGNAGFVSFDDHVLQDGETLLVTIDRMPTRLSVASTSPAVGEPTVASIEGFDAFDFAYEPLEGATLNGASAPLTAADGTTSFSVTEDVTVYASKDGYLPSNEIDITPYEVDLPGVEIALEIYTATETLFSGDLSVLPCAPQDGDSETVNGYCAIEQSGLEATWTWYNFGAPSAFLDKVSGIGNGSGSDNYWTWFADGNVGFTGLNQHTLQEGEKLLVTIDRMPTRLSVATTSPVLGEPTVATVEGFNVFAFEYQALEGAVLTGVDAAPTGVDGETSVTATTTDPLSFYATKGGYLSSNSVTLTAVASSTGSGSGGSGDNTEPDTDFDLSAAYAFLSSEQSEDGSWDSELVTAWAAFAAASQGAPASMKSSLTSYLREEEPSFSSVRDYERHAMALMALNINPYTGGPDDYITPIVESFDGTQIDDDGLVNDDIFALIPLLHAGYTKDDDMIKKITAFIVSEQKGNGSWENSVDVTGAAMQALSGVRSLPGVSSALMDAQDFLRDSQDADGGFGDAFSTSWAIQGIEAVGQSAETWTTGDETPLTYLASVQEDDGGLTTTPDDYSTRAWATAYAIPAVKGLTWDDLMRDFKKTTIAGGKSIKDDEEEEDEETATTTDAILPEAEILVVESLMSTTSVPTFVETVEAAEITEISALDTEEETAEETPAPVPQPAAVGSTGAWEWIKKLFSGIWRSVTGIL